ncbi:MAG: type II toxin-antitoxin system death-on-curing family toxin [Candidatus Hodarchaeales archaeon]
MFYITKEQVLSVYDKVITKFGGERGIISEDILEQCLEIPYQKYYDKEIYQSIEEKAAAFLFNIINLHPFVDGNKRTGYIITRVFLLMNGYDFNCTEEERYNFIIGIASNEENLESTIAWIRANVRKI